MNSLSLVESSIDGEMRNSSFLKEVLVGLSQGQKAIHAKFLPERVELLENDPEIEILSRYAIQMARLMGSGVTLVGPGSGTSRKAKMLLKRMHVPSAYLPVELSPGVLKKAAAELSSQFPHLEVRPILGDFLMPQELPLMDENLRGKNVLFVPGSAIGNFSPDETVQFLKRFGKLLGPRAGFLLGVELKRGEMSLVDQREGNAARGVHLLDRLNRELNANFDKKKFHSRRIYNLDLGRDELHLVSSTEQQVKVSETVFRFREGESIHMESSYRYSAQEFRELCARARLGLRKLWLDERKTFCVYYFEKET